MARQPGRRRPPVRVAGQRRPASAARSVQSDAAALDLPPEGTAAGGAALESATKTPVDAAPPSADVLVVHPSQQPAGVTPSGRLGSRRPELAVGAVAVVLLVLVVLELVSYRHDNATKAARLDASAAARSAVVALISVNYEALPEGRATAVKTLAAKFRPEYDKFLNSLEATAKANKLISSASVETSGVISASPDRVTVLLFVDQISTNASRPAPRIDQPRVKMKMIKVGGKWLVEGFEVV